jgi:UDP-glucose 4-epimerase
MRFLITGCAGGIGSCLSKYLLEQGHEVIGVDDLSCGYPESVPDGVDFYKMTVEQFCAHHKEQFNAPYDAVYHLAAYAAECMSPFCRRYNYANNLMPLAHLLNAIIDSDEHHGRLVFASSMAAYGDVTKPPFDESMHPRPKDPYGIAKLACEMDLRVAGDQHGVDWCVVRPHNVYGPGASIWQRYRNVIGLWMRAVLEGKELVVFGNGTQERAFTYVDDILSPLVQAATAPEASGEIINLGGSQPVQLLDLLQQLSVAVDQKLIIKHEPARHEVKRAWCTVSKSEALLGYRDATPLLDGLRRYWQWAREAWHEFPERREPLELLQPEITRGMPRVWHEDFFQQNVK